MNIANIITVVYFSNIFGGGCTSAWEMNVLCTLALANRESIVKSRPFLRTTNPIQWPGRELMSCATGVRLLFSSLCRYMLTSSVVHMLTCIHSQRNYSFRDTG